MLARTAGPREGKSRMETDRAFAEIFGHRPDWLSLLTGREFPLAASAQPKVFKPKIECDLVLVPAGEMERHVVVEFQFYYDHSIFPRAEQARLAQWRLLNPTAKCRQRTYEPRRVEAFVLFGDRSHLPPGQEDFPHLGFAFLAERLEELERSQPDSPLIPLLRPVTEPSDAVLEARAAEDYRALREHPALEDLDRVYFSTILMHFLMQRFLTKDSKEIKAMIAELTPLEQTRSGKELIEIGLNRGREQEIRRLTLVLLERRFGGEFDVPRRARVESLPLEKTEQLVLTMMEFRSVADLDAWLRDQE